MTTMSDSITIRLAGPGDAAAVRRLAVLDSAEAPAGPALLAEVGGAPAAAIALADGSVVADPFRLTADLVALLELRRGRLVEDDRPARGARRLRRHRDAPLARAGALRHASARLS